MADLQDFILQGTFKGVPFLFNETSKTQGRKAVIYEYPLSINRDTSDLGELQPTYSITAISTGDGAQYFDNKRRFEQALSSPGKGVFVHPTDGQLTAQVDTYTVNETIRDLGRISYSITLIATSEPQFPTITDNTQSSIQNAFDDAAAAFDEAIISAYVATVTYQNALLKYRSFYGAVTNQFLDVLDLVPLDSSALSNFINGVDGNIDNTNTISRSGNAIAESVNSMYDNMTKLNTNTSARSTLNKSFFGFTVPGQDYSNTLARVEAARNRKLMQQHLNSYAITHEFLNTSQTTYTTEKTIEAQSTALNAQYNYILNNNFYIDENGTRQSVFNEDVIDKITFLRDKTTQYLAQQLTNARRVETVYVHNISLVELTLSLYGDMSLYNTLAELNGFANQSTINGSIKVLSQ